MPNHPNKQELRNKLARVLSAVHKEQQLNLRQAVAVAKKRDKPQPYSSVAFRRLVKAVAELLDQIPN